MLGLKLNHVSKSGHRASNFARTSVGMIWTVEFKSDIVRSTYQVSDDIFVMETYFSYKFLHCLNNEMPKAHNDFIISRTLFLYISESPTQPPPFPAAKGLYLFEKEYSRHDNIIKWEHFLRYWPFMWGIHRSPGNSPHKGQWRGALMFSLICDWINGSVNDRYASDLICHRAHYNVIVMSNSVHSLPADIYVGHGMFLMIPVQHNF